MILGTSLLVLFCAITKYALIRMEKATSLYVQACEWDVVEPLEAPIQPSAQRTSNGRRATSLMAIRDA
jgi:hypothetical protein